MSKIILQDVVDQNVTDTLTETNLFVGTIPSGTFPDSAVLIEQTGRYVNSGSSQSYTIRLYVGSSGGAGGTEVIEFNWTTASSALGHAAVQRFELYALDADSLRVVVRAGFGAPGSDDGAQATATVPTLFLTNRVEGLSGLTGAFEIRLTVQLSSTTGTTHQFSSRGVWVGLVDLAAGDATVTPGVIARSFTIPQAGPQASSSVTPAVISRSVSIPQASAGAAADVTPAVISRAVTVPQAGVTASSSVTPAVVSRSIAVPQASPQASSSVTPGAMARSILIPQVVVDTGGTSATVNPALIARDFTIPQAGLSAAANVTPGLISRAFVVPQATPSLGTSVSPALLAGAFVLPQVVVTATGGASVTPAPITMLVVIPQALGQGAPVLIITKEGPEAGGAPSGSVLVVSGKGPA